MSLKVDCRADDSDKHEFDINYMLFHKGKLYSAGDDGRIMVWAADLRKLGEVKSNPCSVYCLAASDTTLYSCSNEGTVKAFELDTLKEKGEIIRDDQTEFWRIGFANNCLYTGDNEGNVRIYKGNKFYGGLNVFEPVKDMVIFQNLLITGNTNIIVTDLKLDNNKLQFGTKNTFDGRAPITLMGDKYIAFAGREAMDIIVQDNKDPAQFRELTKVQGAHEKIINALQGTLWNGEHVLFSGGWDKVVKKWQIDGHKLTKVSSCETEIIINAIAIGEQGEIYVGGSDGHIMRLQVK